MAEFINRTDELAQLERAYQLEGAGLFVLYGRRRVGKTELLRAFCGDRPTLFFVATLGTDVEQLASFSQAIWRFGGDEPDARFTFPTWEAAFRQLARMPGRPVVVLDEFSYLLMANGAIASILQKVWDEVLRDADLLLVLCGSYIGLMEREVLGYQAPLYGRRSASLLLRPLDLRAAHAFLPRYSPVDAIAAWAVLGGMPYYLRMFDDRVSVPDNIRTVILDRRGTLYNEPNLMLLEELREPRNYFAVLRALAHGNTRLNEIAQSAGIGDARTTARYLDLLQQLRLVRRRVPITEARPEKSRRGLYEIDDPFLRFWFRYVHPHRGSLELDLADAVLAQRVVPTFDQYVAMAFEEAARDHVARLARAGQLPFLPDRIGSWWDNSAEVDVAAVSDTDGVLLLGECKWSQRPVGTNALADLRDKAARIDPTSRWPTIHYALFARSGFTPDLVRQAQDEGVLLVTPADLLGSVGE
jgi:hypothetical protein